MYHNTPLGCPWGAIVSHPGNPGNWTRGIGCYRLKSERVVYRDNWIKIFKIISVVYYYYFTAIHAKRLAC